MVERSNTRSYRRGLIAGLLTLALALVAVPVVGQESDGSTLIPETLAGEPAEVTIQVGADVIAGLDPADEDDAAQIAEIETLLAAVGGTIDQLTTATAFPASGDVEGFVVAIRVDGADRAFLTAAFVSSLWADFEQPRLEAAEVEGKPVLLAYDDAVSGGIPFTFYAVGDAVWLLGGEDAFVSSALADLP